VRTVAKPITFTGHVTCDISGTVTANPPISFTSQTSALTLKATLSECVGNTVEKKVAITGGTLAATSSITGSCTSLNSWTKPVGTITWKAVGKPGAAATKQTFTSASTSVNSSTGVISVALPGSGTATSTGSFAGKTSKASIIVDQTESSLAGACLTGVSKLTFSGTNGTSTINVG
jgi:hypothetical protein